MAVLSNKQTGTATIFFSSTSSVVTLPTPVASLSSSILMFSVKLTDTAGSLRPSQSFVRGRFLSTTQISFDRGSSDTLFDMVQPNIEWQVLEFSSGVTVQHFSVAISSGSSSTIQAITSVDITKSFIISTCSSLATTIVDQGFCRNRFTNIVGSSSNQITLDRATIGTTANVEAQVITYDACTVQYKTSLIFAGGSNLAFSALSPSVNLSKTALFMSYIGGYVSPPDQNDARCITGQFLSSSTVIFTTSATIDLSSIVRISYFVVEFTDSTVVQHTNFGLTAGTNNSPTIWSPAISPGSSAVYAAGFNNTMGEYNNNVDSNFVQTSSTMTINSSTAGTIARGSAVSTYNLTLSTFVITFASGVSYSVLNADGVLLSTTSSFAPVKVTKDGIIVSDIISPTSSYTRGISDGVILNTLAQRFLAQNGALLLTDGVKIFDLLNIINARANIIDGITISDSVYAAFIGDPPTDMAANLVIVSNSDAEYLLDWDIDTTGVKTDFTASIDILKTFVSNFGATICVQRDFQVGVVGQGLSGNPNSPIGFFPMCAESGIVVTKQLDCFINATYDGLVPGKIDWSYDPGQDIAGGRGKFEWGSVSVAGHATEIEALSSSYDIRRNIIIDNPPSGASGIYHRTVIYDAAVEPTHGNFINIPSGQYVLKFMIKQSCNPNPYILTSGFVVGPQGWYDLFVARSPGKEGVRPYNVNFYSSRSDVRESSNPTKTINWDFGTFDIWGNDNKIYREPSFSFVRQGIYNPIVTYVLGDGYRLSKEIPEVSFTNVGDGVVLSATMAGSNFHYVLGITDGLIVSDTKI